MITRCNNAYCSFEQFPVRSQRINGFFQNLLYTQKPEFIGAAGPFDLQVRIIIITIGSRQDIWQ